MSTGLLNKCMTQLGPWLIKNYPCSMHKVVQGSLCTSG